MAKDPIRGNPSEFERLEELFCTIKVRTEDLETDLRSIALGTSQEFRGDAADAFSKSLTDLAPALREVPDIAYQVESVFCDHKTQLVQLQRAADSAVARAETRWTEQHRADRAYEDVSGALSSVRRQLMFTPPLDDAERTRLVCRKEDLEGDEAVARARLNRANDNVEESEEELRSLAEDEEQLNERTATRLKRVDVGVLADPSWLEKFVSVIAEAIEFLKDPIGYALENLPTEWLQAIRTILDVFIAVLTAVSIVLDIIGLFTFGAGTLASFVVGLIAARLSYEKLRVSFELYERGALSAAELAFDIAGFVLSLLGLIPGAGIYFDAVSLGLTTGSYLGAAVSAEQDERTASEDGWTVCTVPVPSDDSGSFGTYVIELPDVDAVPTGDGTLIMADIDPVSFAGSISVISAPDVWKFDGMVMDLNTNFGDLSFENLADIVYEMDLDLDLSNFEISIDSHFNFSPPEVVFADFYEAFEQELSPLLVPCELGT